MGSAAHDTEWQVLQCSSAADNAKKSELDKDWARKWSQTGPSKKNRRP